MIALDSKHYAIVKHILASFPYQVKAYGSRARGDCKKTSDLDLCVMLGRPTNLELFYLQQAFEDSDLPFTVDVVVWEMLSLEFQNLIKSDLRDL